MRTNNHGSIKDLFDFEEYLVPQYDARLESELRSLSLRIPVESFNVLDQFAQRWGGTKSSLAAQLLETALNQLETLAQENDDSRRKAEARSAAL